MVILAINLSFSRVSYETGNVVLTFSYAVTRNLGDKENSAQDEANYEIWDSVECRCGRRMLTADGQEKRDKKNKKRY